MIHNRFTTGGILCDISEEDLRSGGDGGRLGKNELESSLEQLGKREKVATAARQPHSPWCQTRLFDGGLYFRETCRPPGAVPS